MNQHQIYAQRILSFLIKSESSYGTSIRANVRALWSGQIDLDTFKINMLSTIERGFAQATIEGIKNCGFTLPELSDKEKSKLDQLISEQIPYIQSYGEAIVLNSKKNKGKLSPLIDRSQLWSSRYENARSTMATLVCSDQKFIWTLGPHDHCPSCLYLSGKVKRGKYWQENNLIPKSTRLKCSIGCGCSLRPTDEPLTRSGLIVP